LPQMTAPRSICHKDASRRPHRQNQGRDYIAFCDWQPAGRPHQGRFPAEKSLKINVTG
jgi:hypothetical protein